MPYLNQQPMTNKEIARLFNELAGLMEIHKENPYKIRTYQNAYVQLRKFGSPLADMPEEEIATIKGVGKSTASKISEILETGTMTKLSEYYAVTPPGIRDMLNIKGLGPKKIHQLWKDLSIESVGELLYACNENRLLILKGFGDKTQEDIKKKIEYFLQSRDKFHYATFEREALELVETLKTKLKTDLVSLTGAIRRKATILNHIEILVALNDNWEEQLAPFIQLEKQKESSLIGTTQNDIPLIFHRCEAADFGSKLFKTTGPRPFLDTFLKEASAAEFKELTTEQAVFEKAGIPFIEPELRDDDSWIQAAKENRLPNLVTNKDIKGVLHNHSTYSDGLNTLREMAEYTREQGYEYLGISDHSKSAFYANGLKPDRVLEQMKEIEELNKELAPFKIFKGIESDILFDGALDYEEDILQQFDFIVASVHSVLKMDLEKATSRLITAVENPYTTILGHPTSRLLLAREGYPIDHKRVIDACAANNVILELNANPHRLDIDWVWIPYAMEKGVKIAINPDAHSKEGIHHIHFGVCAARKGGLTPEMCFNNLSLSEFEGYLNKKHS